MQILCMGIRMPKWKVALLHGLLLIFISYLSLSAGYDYDYEDQKDAWGRCPWIRNTLKNGRVRVRSRGRIAKFICKSGYELVGKKFATCVRGQWNNPVPVCIAKGCPKITAIANGIVTEKYKGAQLIFDCNPGYSLQGDVSINCDGSQWDKTAPRCEAASLQPQKFCDFEDPDLCGWSHDPNHDFDWKRHQFKTPSGHVGTGPSYDHTFGKGKAGYYMYEEASSPRNVNDSSRLFSPVYPTSNSPGCFVFWYHMYGSTIGRLRVYIKPESHVFVELTPVWEKSGEQGNQWLRGNVTVPPLNENFQIVIEGIRGVSYLGDTAIDDVNLLNTSCSSLDSLNATEGEEASVDSCRGRCHESDNSTSCGCTDACESDNTCCSDYAKLCAGGNEPPNGEDETATGKLETDGTPEDKVGTEYTATTPTLSTEFVTLLENFSTVTENNQQPPKQVPTSVVPTTSTSTIAVRMNSSTNTATISAPTVPVVQVSVSRKTTESVSTATQTTNFTSGEIITVKATTATSVMPVSTTKAATTAPPSTKATTLTIPLTTTPQVTAQTTKTVAFTAGVSNSTSLVSGATLIPSTTVTSKQSNTANAPTAPTTIKTAMSPIVTTENTTVTMSITKIFVPPVVTVPSTVRTPINTPKNSEAVTSESVKPLTSTTSTTRMTTTSRVTNSQTTGRTSQTPTTARTTSTSTTRTTPTTVSTSTQAPVVTVRTYRPPPPPRRPTVNPTTTTTLSPYFRRRTTTKTTNLASVFYTAKFQTTTVTTVRDGDGSAELKSQTVVPKSNRSSVIGASIGVIAILCLIGGVTFVFLRRRRQKLDKLHGDSIRFLPDNEVIEYSEASATDPLFQS